LGDSTGGTLEGTVRTVANNRPSVEQLSAEAVAAHEQQPFAQRALLAEIARRKTADTDPGLISAILSIGASMAANPAGRAPFVGSQVPDSIVFFGAGVAGAKGVAALGALTGPFAPVTVSALGTAGFLGGIFQGNTILELGSIALEKASDGFTKQERSDSSREGAIKGGVITGVDAATRGNGRL